MYKGSHDGKKFEITYQNLGTSVNLSKAKKAFLKKVIFNTD